MTPDVVYLDHNATSPVRPEVLEAMLPFLKDDFANPNSAYALGQRTRAAVEAARAHVARLLNASGPDEIVFTSCGSESDVLAVVGAARQALRASRGKKNHVVCSAIEHDAVRLAVRGLEADGFEATTVPVDEYGRVEAQALCRALRPSTAIVSIMHANNEIGTLEPIREFSQICRERDIGFHTDAVQSVGKVPVDVQSLGVDLLSLSGHKINAPKGVGALFIRRGVRLSPVITGHQEKNRRGGTENVAGIVGLGRACRLALEEVSHGAELLRLRRRIEEGCLRIAEARVNGHPTERLPSTCHVSFRGIDGAALVVALDLEGICVSSGPACSTGVSEPSHVLRATGLDPVWARGGIRVSLGWGSRDSDVDRFLGALPHAVEKIRQAQRLPSSVL
ncbi:MAG: cysteine desulfurase [Elusimicrobia bacterium]|nr:cysteine desulfurase [Elusimicrobiota bacterium]